MNVDVILKEFGEPKQFQPHVVVNTIGKCVEIYLEDCSYYADWIADAGGDISLLRSNEDNHIVGAILPFNKWNEKFPVITI